jgi:hypothetical protein
MNSLLNTLDALRDSLVGKEVDINDFKSLASFVVEDVYLKEGEPETVMVKVAIRDYKAAKFRVEIERIELKEDK